MPVQFGALFDHATAMIDVWDNETRKYVFVSNSITYIAGFEPNDLLDRGVDFTISRMHPDDRKEAVFKSVKARKAVEQYEPGVDDTKPYVSFEFRFLHKDGHYIWLRTDSSVYSRLPNGKLKYIVGTTVNIDEQKAYEERLQKSFKRLEESQARLREEHEQLLSLNSAKDEFVSIASHQLRAPASGVKQYLGLLLQNYVGTITKDQKQILEAANECNERQIQIVNDLLNVAKINAGKVQLRNADTDLAALASGVVEEQSLKSKARGQTINFQNESGDTYFASVDALLIRMVLENLIDNACKYSPEGSAVQVRIFSDNGFAVIEVEDRGIGIAEEDRSKLFKKFSRIQNARTSDISGTGLGLYWAKQIIDLHRGELKLKSSSDSGSTFSFSLPLIQKV